MKQHQAGPMGRLFLYALSDTDKDNARNLRALIELKWNLAQSSIGGLKRAITVSPIANLVMLTPAVMIKVIRSC